jgi:dTDP-4-dehydrorhamnose 3,5-epimerase
MVEFDTLGAQEDRATVSSSGDTLARTIEGVIVRRPVVHVDHRGRLFEVVNQDEQFWEQPVVHGYVFTIRANTVKGWGVHEGKSDRYCLISGETMTLLYDARADSPTRGLVQEVALSPEGDRMVLIPPGVWHLSINTAPHETVLINHPTKAYDYQSPDRLTLPWHTDQIPVDVSKYFPRQMAGMDPSPQR